MKRINNLYTKIYDFDNLLLADANASKGKSDQYGVIIHNQNKIKNLLQLQEILKNKTYKTSAYTTFTIREPKERIVYRLPYFPDRIVHHAVMNILKPIFTSTFITHTYSCIEGKGIHATANAVKSALKNTLETQYCLKLDIKKFYPNIDHSILKQLLRKKFKDNDLLLLLDGIIDSADGIPIGNYLSQYFANYYLTFFDHWIKEDKAVKYYFRYCDDLVILSGNKPYLHQLLAEIRTYLAQNLKLTIKQNYQIFPVDDRSIDFVGYCFYHSHTLLRKGIKQNFARMIANNKNKQSIASYNGWAKHADCKHLLKKLIHD